jgi:DNA-directed RNA polymerase specialized sigma subunit
MPIAPFEHPLWEGSRVFTDEDANALLYRLSDPSIRQQMIEGYTRLALGISGQYLTMLKSRRWVDDVVSAALVGVIVGVDCLADRVQTEYVEHPRALVAQQIHWHISAMLKQENTQCKDITYVGGADWFDTLHAQNERAAEIESSLDSLAENETEQLVLNLRKLGYTDREVADQLGLHQQSVQVIRQDLHRRFCDLLPGGKSNENETTEAPEGVNHVGAGSYEPTQGRCDTKKS